MTVRICELCNAEATVFCPSDSAFLCWTCDAKVHQVNFLVARHFRHPLICNHIGDDDLDSHSSSNSSVCITSPPKDYPSGRRNVGLVDSSSSINEVKRQRVNRPADYLKAEEIFLNWSGKLGVGDEVAVRIACRAVRVCLDRLKVLPMRVCLAASMWLGLRIGADRDKSVMTWQVLKRLEEISGVPAKLILVAEWKVERAVRAGRQQHRRRVELEEGWAEC